MKLLLYCTKSKPYLYDDGRFKKYSQILNGKIVAECDYEVERIWSYNEEYQTNSLIEVDLCRRSCLTHQKLFDYFKRCMTGYNWLHNGYAIHIKNLHILDEPKELDDYKIFDKSYENCFAWAFTEEEKNKLVTKAPQNMMYVFDGNEKKVLISIHPEHLCKILNGEKTVEVRKKVLKCMYKYEWRKERCSQ